MMRCSAHDVLPIRPVSCYDYHVFEGVLFELVCASKKYHSTADLSWGFLMSLKGKRCGDYNKQNKTKETYAFANFEYDGG